MRRRPVIPLIAVLLLLLPLQRSLAQPGAITPRNLIFTPLSTYRSQGPTDMWKIMQDRQGLLWFTSTGGLHRYDGHDFKHYYHDIQDSTSIPPYYVWEIEEDPAGNIWVATAEGLRIFDPLTERFNYARFGDSVYLQTANTWVINHDRKDRMWVSTKGYGFYVFDLERDTVWHFQHDPTDPASLSDNIVVDMIEDRDGTFWIATMGGGINRLDSLGGLFARYAYQPDSEQGLPSNTVTYLTEDRHGHIWAATWNGVAVIDRKTDRVTTYQHDPLDAESLVNDRAWHIYRDTRQRIWVSTNGGISIYDEARDGFVNYTYDPINPAGIPDDFVRFVFEDKAGHTWVATANGVVMADYYSTPFSFQLLRKTPRTSQENAHDGISAIVEDRKGRRWMSTQGGGIYQYDPQENTYRLHQFSGNSADNLVWSLAEDQQGRIWAGTAGSTLLFNESSGTFRPVFTAGEPAHTPLSVYGITADTKGNVWFAADNGLFVLTPDTSACRKVPGSLDVLNCIYADQRGRIWLGSQKGLQIYQPEDRTFTHFAREFDPPYRLNSNWITDIAEGPNGNIWVASPGGLHQMLPGADLRSFTVKPWNTANCTLPVDRFESVAVDASGQLWLLGEREVFRFRPGADEVQRFSPLPPTDLATGKFTQTRDGAYYFGSYFGSYRFLPDSVVANTTPPAVIIKDFRLFNRSVPLRGSFGDTLGWESPLTESIRYAESIRLQHWQNDFSFEFAALNYSNPDKNQYYYRLEGYNEDWISPATDYPIASYTNIKPGRYTFRVIATNDNGVRNETGAAIRITILPPWYWAGWSKFLYALFLAGGLYAAYRVQIRRSLDRAETERLQELNTLKTRLYTNITHEFRTPLTVILGTAQQLENNSQAGWRAGLEAIRRSGRRLLQLVNQMLDLSRLETGNLPVHSQQGDVVAYVAYLVQSFQSYAVNKQVELHFEKGSESAIVDFSPDLLAKIIDNLLTNALKFTPPGGTVTVSTHSTATRLRITVADQGIGIPAEALPHIFDRFYQVDSSSTRPGEGVGIGLALVKELVDLLGGRITVTSQVNQGTIFHIELPITHEAPLLPVEMPERDVTGEAPIGAVAHSVSNDPTRHRVLIIEDNQDVTAYIASCLENAYHITTAPNGQAGIDQAQAEIPDLIICDVMMPAMNGYEVCEVLKTDERTSHIPIVLLTARADEASRVEGLRRGADAYLVKPFNRQELEIRIEKLIELRDNLRQRFAAFPQLDETVTLPFPLENAFLKQLNDLVRANLSDESFGVAQVCQAIGVSRSQLHRKLVALTGRSASLLIRSIRLHSAKELLIASDLNISEIAFRTGFSSHSYFSAVFYEEFALTPSEFRANG